MMDHAHSFSAMLGRHAYKMSLACYCYATAASQKMEVKLEAISPVVYSLMKVGAVAEVKRQMAKKNEYREKIPIVHDTLVVFKGITKVGIIPRDKVSQLGANYFIGKCRIVAMDQSTSTVVVEFPQKRPQSVR